MGLDDADEYVGGHGKIRYHVFRLRYEWAGDGRDDDVSGLVPSLCSPGLLYVVGHDDRYDAAQCGIRCSIVFRLNPSKSILIQSSSVSLDFPIGLSYSLGFLQFARNSITMAW